MRKHMVLLAAISSLGFASQLAHADVDLATLDYRALGIVSPDKAKQAALKAKPGAITEADLEKRPLRDGLQYEFEILDAQGNQWDIKVDAKNGDVLSVKKEIL